MADADPATKPKAATNKPIPAFSLGAKVLHAALKDVLGVISSRNTIPILSHVLI